MPTPTDAADENGIYSGWLYAAVVTTSGNFDGLFVTKDFGQNWTQVTMPTLPSPTPYQEAIATNDVTQPNYAITLLNEGNLYLTLTLDPTNPNIVYLGSFGGDNGATNLTDTASDTGLIRVDTTDIWDAHALVAYSDIPNNGGDSLWNSSGAAPVNTNLATPIWEEPTPFGYNFVSTSYVDFIRNPDAPFLSDSTLYVNDYNAFANNGAGVTWIPFDTTATGNIPGTGYQAAVSAIDPTTGLPRLIFGNSQGIWSVLDDDGTFETSIGLSDATPGTNRNGNLSITQFYYGAVQPGNAAAQIAGALFYGASQDNGGPFSDPNILSDGNTAWNVLETGPYTFDASEYLSSTSVAVDQQGVGTLDQYWTPDSDGLDSGGGSDDTNFLQVNNIGSTFGLLQAAQGLPTPDPQWTIEGITNFAVNPVNGDDMVISSDTGNIFATQDDGATWFDIGTPVVFGLSGGTGDASLALAYGAPDPTVAGGIGNLGNFIYVGTATGQIYATQVGGGSSTSTGGSSNSWILVGSTANGLDGSQIESIVTDPTRGSHEAYAVTEKGVYFIVNSIPSTNNSTPTWVNITGNIFQLSYDFYGQSYNPTTDSQPYDLATSLTSIVADWNYTIPNDPSNLNDGYHPVLFVSANAGVYMSTNQGQTWTLFPDVNFGALTEGGYLPNVNVTDLSLSLGDIDPNTGMPHLAGPYEPGTAYNPSTTPDPDLMMASTFGQGAVRHQHGADVAARNGPDRTQRCVRRRRQREPDRDDGFARHSGRQCDRGLRLRECNLDYR